MRGNRLRKTISPYFNYSNADSLLKYEPILLLIITLTQERQTNRTEVEANSLQPPIRFRAYQKKVLVMINRYMLETYT